MPVLIIAAVCASTTPPAVVVMQTTRMQNASEELAAGINDAMATEMQRSKAFSRVMTLEDLAAVLTVESGRQLLGCDDTGCLRELGAMSHTEYALYPSVARSEDRFIVSAKLVFVASGEVAGASTRTLVSSDEGDALLAARDVANEALAQWRPPPRDGAKHDAAKESTPGFVWWPLLALPSAFAGPLVTLIALSSTAALLWAFVGFVGKNETQTGIGGALCGAGVLAGLIVGAVAIAGSLASVASYFLEGRPKLAPMHRVVAGTVGAIAVLMSATSCVGCAVCVGTWGIVPNLNLTLEVSGGAFVASLGLLATAVAGCIHAGASGSALGFIALLAAIPRDAEVDAMEQSGAPDR